MHAYTIFLYQVHLTWIGYCFMVFRE